MDTQLKSKPKLIRCRDNKGNNPLHFAAKTSDVETVDMLVKKGCDPFAQNYVTFFSCSLESSQSILPDILITRRWLIISGNCCSGDCRCVYFLYD